MMTSPFRKKGEEDVERETTEDYPARMGGETGSPTIESGRKSLRQFFGFRRCGEA